MKLYQLLPFVLLSTASTSFASEESSNVKPVESSSAHLTNDSTQFSAEVAAPQRPNHFLLGSFAPADSWIPYKFGLSLGLHSSSSNSLELEYLANGIGTLMSLDEQRISLLGRSHILDNSFNLIYGLGYSGLSASANLSIMNVQVTSLSLMEIKSLGLHLGLGNRWDLGKNMVLGVDWLNVFQPLYNLGSLADRSLSDHTAGPILNFLTKLPRLGFLKVQFGLRF